MLNLFSFKWSLLFGIIVASGAWFPPLFFLLGVLFVPLPFNEATERDCLHSLLYNFLFEVLNHIFFEVEGWPWIFTFWNETRTTRSRGHKRLSILFFLTCCGQSWLWSVLSLDRFLKLVYGSFRMLISLASTDRHCWFRNLWFKHMTLRFIFW